MDTRNNKFCVNCWLCIPNLWKQDRLDVLFHETIVHCQKATSSVRLQVQNWENIQFRLYIDFKNTLNPGRIWAEANLILCRITLTMQTICWRAVNRLVLVRVLDCSIKIIKQNCLLPHRRCRNRCVGEILFLLPEVPSKFLVFGVFQARRISS